MKKLLLAAAIALTGGTPSSLHIAATGMLVALALLPITKRIASFITTCPFRHLSAFIPHNSLPYNKLDPTTACNIIDLIPIGIYLSRNRGLMRKEARLALSSRFSAITPNSTYRLTVTPK